MEPEETKLVVKDLDAHKILVSYQQDKRAEQEIPLPAKPAKKPCDVENNEQLFLTGQHIEQYRHATFEAIDYYEEALRRDENDIRSNNALGLLYLRRGKFAEAEAFFRKAIGTSIERNPNPYNGEPYYNVGVALKMQCKNDEAFDAFYKCIWNDAWQHAGYLNLARIATQRNDFEEALALIDKSIVKNHHSHTARHLKTVILRKLERDPQAISYINESLVLDPFNFGCLFEKYLLLKANTDISKQNEAIKKLKGISRDWEHNFIEYAFDYAHAGLYNEASQLLLLHASGKNTVYPMIFYYLAWFADKLDSKEKALNYFKQAASINPDFCFPNRFEDVIVLAKAIELNPLDANAPYYLGNYWYDKREYKDAIHCWERSVAINNSFPTVHRNLSLAYFNKLNDPPRALQAMEAAFCLDDTDARVLMELDQLRKRLNTPHKTRLEFLEKHLHLTETRDDVFLERITLYNQLGQYMKARDLLSAYKFHPWEGGEGKVVTQYLVCHIELAKQAIYNGENEKALQLLSEAEHYPENLGEGKLFNANENDIDYLKALSYEQMNNLQEAKNHYQKASEGNSEPMQAIFYNDPRPDKIFYQGLAFRKLNRVDDAMRIFNKLIAFGQQHLNDTISIDYFAVSLPDLLVFDADLSLRNKIHCLYLMGLGHLGLENTFNKSLDLFNEVLQLDVNHQGALTHKQMMMYLSTTAH